MDQPNIARVVISNRKNLVDNSLDIGGPTVLSVGLYMRHIESGRVYPFEREGAKREDVEIFRRDAAGNETKIIKPKKVKKSPFERDRAVNYEGPLPQERIG
jgi:hypothetical protein